MKTPNALNAIWYDKRIKAGDAWEPLIMDKIRESRVALLLVSPDFLSSEFIRKVEVPKIEELRNKKQLTFIPVIIKKCECNNVDFVGANQTVCLDEPFETLNDVRRIDALGKLAKKIALELLA